MIAVDSGDISKEFGGAGMEGMEMGCDASRGVTAAGEHARRLLKVMKDSLGEMVASFRPFVANVRELLKMRRVKYISGRPRKRKPPDMTPMLPGFPA